MSDKASWLLILNQNPGTTSGYRITRKHDGEVARQLLPGDSVFEGGTPINKKTVIIVKDGTIVQAIDGELVEEIENEQKARRTQARMQSIYKIHQE